MLISKGIKGYKNKSIFRHQTLGVFVSGLNESQFITRDQNTALGKCALLAEKMKDQNEDLLVKD